MNAWRRDGADLVLAVQVQPRAGRDEITGVTGDCLKVRIGAAPVDGAANARLVAFLAECFGVPQRQVLIEHGGGGRRKRVRVVAPRRLPPAIAAS
jgi:hypothetical protein